MDKLSVFSAITAAAVVLQALVLLAIFLALRKTSARVESLADGAGGVLDTNVAIAVPRLFGQRLGNVGHGRCEPVTRSATGGRFGITGIDFGELPGHGVGRP